MRTGFSKETDSRTFSEGQKGQNEHRTLKVNISLHNAYVQII